MNSIDEKQSSVDGVSKSDCSEDCCHPSSLTALRLAHTHSHTHTGGCHPALTSHGLAMSPWLSDPAMALNMDMYSTGEQIISNRSRQLIYSPVSFYQESAALSLPVSLSVPLALPFASPPSAPSTSASSLAVAVAARRRSRGEKKPTPEDQKDQRYLERRRRNNTAAKKSRDARRAREDQIALRACILEHENAVLRAQLIAIRNESDAMRTLFLSRRSNSSDNIHSS